MSAEWIQSVVCPRCLADSPATAMTCPACGAPLAASSRAATQVRLIDRPWAVLGMIFLAMAILGLPLLWISRGFSTPMKVVWTIIIILYTALLFWLFYLVMAWSIGNMVESWRQMF